MVTHSQSQVSEGDSDSECKTWTWEVPVINLTWSDVHCSNRLLISEIFDTSMHVPLLT